MCDAWRDSFAAFLRDMGEMPESRNSIGRIDNSGNYEPGNCRWETPLEQARNKRNNSYATLNGETLHVNAWARRFGVAHTAIHNWKRNHGVSLQETIERFASK